MGTVYRDRPEFKVASATGQVAACFDGISLSNFHTLSFAGSATAGTFNGVSLTESFNPLRTFKPETATLPQCANMIATIILSLGRGR